MNKETQTPESAEPLVPSEAQMESAAPLPLPEDEEAHPLAEETQDDGLPRLRDPRELPQLLEELLHVDVVPTLSVLAHALDTISADADLPINSRLALSFQCDQAGRRVLETARRGFVQSVVNGSGRHRVVWGAAEEFQAALCANYHASLLRSGHFTEHTEGAPLLRAELAVRLVRAFSRWMTWRHLNYGPYDSLHWVLLGDLFLRARADASHTQPFIIDGYKTSIEREYLHANAVFCATVDQLPVDLIDLTDRLIDRLLTSLQLVDKPVAGATHTLSPGAGEPPRRLTRVPTETGLWFFNPSGAAAKLEDFAIRAAEGKYPAEMEHEPAIQDRLQRCIAHLRRTWSVTPPARRHRRHPLNAGLSAINGLDSLIAVLEDDLSDGKPSWRIDDVSRGGLGALAPDDEIKGLQVGGLIGLRPEETAAWQLGIVRRLQRGAGGQTRVGVETLSREPVAVQADDGRGPVDVVVCDPLRAGEAVRIVAPFLGLRGNNHLFLTIAGTLYKLRPLGQPVGGMDYEVRAYQVL